MPVGNNIDRLLYLPVVIITKDKPYTVEEIKTLSEQFEVYIKTVIDVERKICSAGCDRCVDSEQLLLQSGSLQKNLWGGGIDVETKIIDFNSFINIRPGDNNTSNEIQDAEMRKKYEKLTFFFFKEMYE